MTQQLLEIRAQADDMTGEQAGRLMDILTEDPAIVDAYYISVHMKKNRPGLLITLFAAEEALAHAAELLFTHSSTIGLRYTPVSRIVMQREIKKVYISTPLGPRAVRVKCCQYHDIHKTEPEYEDLAALSRETGLSVAALEKAVFKVV